MADYTIDELAQRAGITTRNVRAYQERGLLPPPRKVGRVGRYDEAHLARLRVIAELLGRGWSLAAIREIGQTGADAGVLGLESAVGRPWQEEAPAHLTAEQVNERFPGDEPDLVTRAIGLGLLEPDGDGFRVPSLTAFNAGAELVAAGVPLDEVLDQAEALRADAERIAHRFVELFLRHVWAPFVERGMPAEEIPQIAAMVERMRPLTTSAVLPALNQAMDAAVAEAMAEVIGSLADTHNEAAS